MTIEAQFTTNVERYGIPPVWCEFGSRMSQVGALASALARAVAEAHAGVTPETKQAALRLFDEQDANLSEARGLLAEQLVRYRKNGRWDVLDAVVKAADIDAVIDTLRPHFGLHPYPVVVESTRFNFEYVQRHGFESFYRMTDDYLGKIEEITVNGRMQFEGEVTEVEQWPPFWLYKLEMASIEVPSHCHVCKNIITYAEHNAPS